MGKRKGVKKLLGDKVPGIVDLGSCNDHHLANSMKHGVEAFDSDVPNILVNIFIDLGGAKGYGLKKKK